MAVFSNSPIDDNIIRYLALRSLLLQDYFLSFNTFCFYLLTIVQHLHFFEKYSKKIEKQD
jgi:hypothetical protein